jgi:hypothetical protein
MIRKIMREQVLRNLSPPGLPLGAAARRRRHPQFTSLLRRLSPPAFNELGARSHTMRPRAPHTLHHARKRAMGDAMGDPFSLRVPKKLRKVAKAIKKFQPGKHLGTIAALATLPFGGAGFALKGLGAAARLGGGLLRGAASAGGAIARTILRRPAGQAETFASEMGGALGAQFQQAFDAAPTPEAKQDLVQFARGYGFDVSDAAAAEEASLEDEGPSQDDLLAFEDTGEE